uniref:Reverse transcriptase domain-containing protein n=1 Tax=Tanacetum cinerariifolium TaxID=118510 RepID=A0A6L2LIS8_TANCI|nr:reverse transcriptase domain-containing protein [Tanacetum cinerariifolium]
MEQPDSLEAAPQSPIQTPPVPHEEDEHEPMFIQLHDPDNVPEPMYPEYIPLEDEHVFPAEEQPLPPVVLPTAELPGYVAESNPEEDLEEYEDDETEDGPVNYPMDGGDDGDDDDDDSSGDDADDEDKDEDDDDDDDEEHLAPADFAVVVPTVEPVSPPDGLEPVEPPPSTYITTIGARIIVQLQVKERQEKGKIRSKPDKNGKRGEAKKSQSQSQSSSKLSRDQTSNPTSSTNPTPKGRIHRSSKQKVENSNFEEHLPPVATMTDNHTMAEMLRAPTEGCAEAIVKNTASTSGSGSLPGNTVANPKGELKAITTRSGLVTDGPTIPNPPKSVTPEEDECVEETYTDPDLVEYTIKVPPPLVQKQKPSVQRNFVLHTRDSPLPNIPYPSRMLKQKQQEKDDIQIQKFWHIELKCKALADLGASINLMPLSVWKKLGLPDLIPTCMTLELANHAICTPDGIVRDVFVPVGKFTFPADFVVVDYESDPKVLLILGRPFLITARSLIDVHGEEMILRVGDEGLTLNMKHDTANYSNHPHIESANLINIFSVPSEDCLEDSVLNQKSGNPTFSLHKEIASPEVTHEIHDLEGCNFLSEELPDIDSFNDIHPHFDDNPLSGSTTYSSNSLLEEFTDEFALITYPPDYDDNLKCDIESDLREIEFLLYQGKGSVLKDSMDQTDLANLDDYFVDPTPEMFNDEHAPDYSFPPRFDVYPDDFLEIESDADNFYDDTFDSKGEKIKEFELLIDELDLPCDILPYPEYDSFASQDFSRDDDLPSTDNEDKVKERQEKNKIRSKSDKNGKRGEAGKSQSQSQSREKEK